MIDAILQAWGGHQSARELKNRENRVFDVTLQNGTRAALRLHRPGYQTATAIRSELLWMQRLAQNGFPCPRPIATDTDGQVLLDHNGQLCSLISWVDGPQIGAMGQDTPLNPVAHCDLYHQIGQLIAQLHSTTDQLDTSDITRPAWDADALLGRAPAWGRFWENPALDADEQAFMKTARDAARERLADFSTASFGLIHADFMQENILQNDTGLWLIDFDDSGVGYRLYDPGTALIQHADAPHFDGLLRAVADGFGANPDDIRFFMCLRSFASAGWAVPRMPLNDPKQRIYAARGLKHARWLLGQ